MRGLLADKGGAGPAWERADEAGIYQDPGQADLLQPQVTALTLTHKLYNRCEV